MTGAGVIHRGRDWWVDEGNTRNGERDGVVVESVGLNYSLLMYTMKECIRKEEVASKKSPPYLSGVRYLSELNVIISVRPSRRRSQTRRLNLSPLQMLTFNRNVRRRGEKMDCWSYKCNNLISIQFDLHTALKPGIKGRHMEKKIC